VPESLERKAPWLALEHIGGRSVSEVVDLVNGYQRRFLDGLPTDGDGAIYKSIVLVFNDLPVDVANGIV